MAPAAPARDTTGPYLSRDCARAAAPLLVGLSPARPASHSYFPNADSVRSRRARFEHRNRNRLAGADVIAVNQRAAIVAQADRLRAQGEGALLARFDESKTATAGEQKIGGAGGIGEVRPGAREKYKAWLFVAGAGRDRTWTRRLAQYFGESDAGEDRLKRRDDDRVYTDRHQHNPFHRPRERAFGAFLVIQLPGEEAADDGAGKERPGQQRQIAFDYDRSDDGDDADDHRDQEPPHDAADKPWPMRQHAGLDRARGQDRDRRIERQHVVRQLGDNGFEHDPRWHQPGQKKARGRLAPYRPDRGHREPGQDRRGKECHKK